MFIMSDPDIAETCVLAASVWVARASATFPGLSLRPVMKGAEPLSHREFGALTILHHLTCVQCACSAGAGHWCRRSVLIELIP